MNRSVRAAVVGTGFIGVVHVEALRRLGIEVCGVVGSSPERAREKAKTAVLPEPYESFEAMLADERVDVVHNTSPNKEHYPQAKAALEAGKHVVCEKPLVMDSRETAELLELANRSGLVHAVNFNIRFYSQVIEAHERVARGDIGAVHQVTGSYLQDWLLLETDWNWRLDPAEGGELRAVGDIGSHWIDLLQYVSGRRVESVIADLKTVIPVRQVPTGPVETFSGGSDGERVAREIETEDIAGIMLRLEGGARAICAVSQLSAGRRFRRRGTRPDRARGRCPRSPRRARRGAPAPRRRHRSAAWGRATSARWGARGGRATAPRGARTSSTPSPRPRRPATSTRCAAPRTAAPRRRPPARRPRAAA